MSTAYSPLKNGLLLLNLGSPAAATPVAVRAFLKAFLSDPKVIELPQPFRWLLVNGLILPFRTQRSTALYQKIWQPEGSPLIVGSQHLVQACTKQGLTVALGMRYGSPSIRSAVEALCAAQCQTLTVLPLFPHYTQSSTGSALQAAATELRPYFAANDITWIESFSEHPAFIEAWVNNIRAHCPPLTPNTHLIFSYHGIPERQDKAAQGYYRAQCEANTLAITTALGYPSTHYTTTFQSRLGYLPWLQPYTNSILPKLRAQGIEDLVVLAPSFVIDCLETLEELDIQLKAQWADLGGTGWTRIPCLNQETSWILNLLHDVSKTA